jgi:hypothetical protein
VLEPEEGSKTGGERENGSAEVSDPAGEKEERVGVAEVGGRKRAGGCVKKVTGVIERHDDHDCTAQRVDGLDTRAGSGGCGHLSAPLSRETLVEGKDNSWASRGASEIASTLDGEDDA